MPGMPITPSPPVGEGGARAAAPRGRVRGSKREALPSWTTERGRTLRRNATEAETALWRALREKLPHAKFRRQQALGPYFADFCSHAAKLVIEVDGRQHAEAETYDSARTRFIENEGFRVLRFWNNDVLGNPRGVLEAIALALSPRGRGLGEGESESAPQPETNAPHPPTLARGPLPLPQGERE